MRQQLEVDRMHQGIAPVSGARPLVVTWCSARKRDVADVVLKRHGKHPQPVVEAAWRAKLKVALPTATAVELYAGRAFALAREAARRAAMDLSVVSAGLGWVTGTTKVPSYDLTISRDALASHVAGTFDAAAWWESAVDGPFSTKPSVDLLGRPLVLACVSQEYAPFFAMELERVPLERLRIFGAGIARKFPASLLPAILPYDDRLGGLTGGTRADFAQRALQHFLFTLTPSESLETDHVAVADAMLSLPLATIRPMGRRSTDNEVRNMITALLPTVGMRRTPMLRHLRDVLGIACEQGRFAQLFAEVTKA